jgi:hypothetical protein
MLAQETLEKYSYLWLSTFCRRSGKTCSMIFVLARIFAYGS